MTLRNGYVDEDAGRHLADLLEARRAIGDFDQVSNPVELGRALTALLQAEANDRHLIIWAPGGEPAELRLTVESQMISRAEVLDEQIGYIDIRTFAGKSEEIDAAMERVKAADALIIDVGNNLGGNPPIVQHFSSYFFADRTHLLNVFARGMSAPEERWTLSDVPGPRLPPPIPLYILTSSRTFSAVESFAFGLRVAR